MKDSFTLFSFAKRNLRRKPLRTAVLVISIGILVSALVFVLSFVRRVDSVIKVTSDRLGADIIIVPSGSRSAAEDILLENKVKTFYMDKGLVEKVAQIRGHRGPDSPDLSGKYYRAVLRCAGHGCSCL